MCLVIRTHWAIRQSLASHFWAANQSPIIHAAIITGL
jgi:hypothetical protein